MQLSANRTIRPNASQTLTALFFRNKMDFLDMSASAGYNDHQRQTADRLGVLLIGKNVGDG